MASGHDTAGSSKPEILFEDPRTYQKQGEDDFMQIHSATATTDYEAFVGKEEYLSSEDSAAPSKPRPVSRAKAKKSRKAQRAAESSNSSNRPLRPALDVLSRLRHDPEYSCQSFTVGYLDRHSPEVMELPITAWKGGDVTDEEFIPQHRILWFKRDSDDKKMWDRKERLDEIFGRSGMEGSGAGSESASPALAASPKARSP